jgi:hypothetical protein
MEDSMGNPHERLPDEPDPGDRPRARGSQREDESDERNNAGSEPEVFDAGALLPGAVLMVPNRHWGFEVVSATDHPGACTHYQPGAKDAILVKGTDAENVRNARRYFFADASAENGLQKRTAFELVPRVFRLHRLKLLFQERYLGRLEQMVLQALRAELARLHPAE